MGQRGVRQIIRSICQIFINSSASLKCFMAKIKCNYSSEMWVFPVAFPALFDADDWRANSVEGLFYWLLSLLLMMLIIHFVLVA